MAVVVVLLVGSSLAQASLVCRPELVTKYVQTVDRVTADYAARALSCSEAKTLELAMYYSQHSGCVALENTVKMVNDVLDQRNENPGYFSEIVRPCP